MTDSTRHVWATYETTGTEITWTCTCGWVTIETIPAPSHHIPVAQRKADHIREATDIDERTAARRWMLGDTCGCPDDVPTRHDHRLTFVRPPSGHHQRLILTACWTGGFKTIYRWRCDPGGLTDAQAFCDKFPTIWERKHLNHWPVKPGELAQYAS
jgi:hypothetical protein